jgi:protein-disulfide isomerase-like protein with CxxC motif
MVQFGDEARWTFVMGGLARDLPKPFGDGQQVYGRLTRNWLEAAAATEMPIDPRLWSENPISSTYPACMAVKAASEQAADGGYRYLRRLREALLCERRKLDHVEALVEEARAAGLDPERFRRDLGSNATTEAFAADLDATRAAAPVTPVDGRSSPGAGETPLPTVVFESEDGRREVLSAWHPYEAYRAAALAAGARPVEGPPPSVEELIARFGRVATKEVEVVCGLPGPRAAAALFGLAEERRLRPVRRMTGYLWEKA